MCILNDLTEKTDLYAEFIKKPALIPDKMPEVHVFSLWLKNQKVLRPNTDCSAPKSHSEKNKALPITRKRLVIGIAAAGFEPSQEQFSELP